MLQRAGALLLLLSLVIALAPQQALSKIGVGIGTGKIQVDEQLKPGLIYTLPSLNVLNTGDEESDYEIDISYHEGQSELKPKKEWFAFAPAKFHLKPNESQVVEMKINLPLAMEPGNYFAYVEAHPTATAQQGDTKIGIAAGTKLYFTVVPSNIFSATYYRLVSFWNVYAPWPKRALYVIIGIGAWFVAKRFLHIQVGVKPTKDKDANEN